MEESIYNIIPRDYQPEAKGPLYKSKYPPTLPPTGSTFGNHTTSKPGVSNLSGDFAIGLQAHTQKAQRGTFGYLKHDRKPSPDSFQKKHTGTMGSNTLPPVRNFSYDVSYKKAEVPKHNQRPVLGLKSDKNFIVSNAIQNILSTARKSETAKDWLHKDNYGKVPRYLGRIKNNIDQEYRMIQTMHYQSTENKQVLSPEQVHELREGLKAKWDQINKEYQRKTHIKLVDTTGSKRRKEDYETQLRQIENDIKKLNKAYVFVE